MGDITTHLRIKIFYFLFLQKIYFSMMKNIFAMGVLLVVTLVVVNVSGEEDEHKGKELVSEICSKCEYCEKDPDCNGCSKCSECTSRKEEGCRFCRKKETEDECVARCKKDAGSAQSCLPAKTIEIIFCTFIGH